MESKVRQARMSSVEAAVAAIAAGTVHCNIIYKSLD